MEFISSRPDVVRSTSQRWLLSHWNQLRQTHPTPAWSDLKLGDIAPIVIDNLLFCEVVPGDEEPRFRLVFRGERVAEAYGDCEGKFLDETLPDSYRRAALGIYFQVLATSLPVYTIADLRDQAGRIIHHERLLLPFGHDGTVDCIVASLEIVSPEGTFENRGVMTTLPRPPALALCTTIQH